MNRGKPLVSIIVTVYNIEEYLQECLDSIREQSYENLDIILVDDGSTDKSTQICLAYEKVDSRVRVFRKANGGLISAWIYGVRQAAGQYVCFVDGDDWIDPDMIEGLVDKSCGNCKEIICSNYVIEREEKKESTKVTQGLPAGSYDRKAIEKFIIPKLLGNEKRSIHSSRCMKLTSKELIIDNIQYTNHRITMGEDLNIMYPVFLDAERITIVEQGYYYHYRFVDSSMAHKYNSTLVKKIELLYHTLQNIIIKKIEDTQIQKQALEDLKREYIFLLFLAIKNELRGCVKGYGRRIKQLILDRKSNELKDVQIKVETKANKLLYMVWKKPNMVTIGIAKMAISFYDKR